MKTTAEKLSITIYTQAEWRYWLETNHRKEQSVWVICHTKKSGLPAVSWSELVDEALCFGWIDSTRKTIDTHTFKQLFSRRKPNSTWSKINKEKVQQLIDSKLMSAAGLECIQIAKENGSWTILDTVEALTIPSDLEAAFVQYEGSKAYFLSLSKSIRKMMLHWIVLARRPETRQKRIEEIVAHAAKNERPKRFQPINSTSRQL